MNETPVTEDLTNEESFQSRTKIENTLSNRILGWAFAASVIVNIGWVALVSGSNLFGKGGAVPQLHERPLKVFKPIPVKPKPKPVKPPPPPPKPKIQPKITPIHPHPTPPQPQRHQVQIHTTTNTHTTSTLSAPPAPPPPPGPFVPTYTATPPAPPAPPVPPTPPAPPAPPTPPAPPPPRPAPPAPPPPPPPPPPVVRHPANYNAQIDTQDAVPPSPDNLGVGLDGIDGTSITNSKIVISFTIDETGHVRNAHVTESCGNSELDNRYRDAIARSRCTPAIQDHIPRDSRQTITIPVST